MAITITLEALKAELGSKRMGGAKRGEALLAVATALVRAEGGDDAPAEVSNECVILVACYLQNRRDGSVSEKKMGDLNIKYRAVGSAVRLSGARTLLSPWRERGLPVEPT